MNGRQSLRTFAATLLIGGVLAACAGDAATVSPLSAPATNSQDIGFLKRGLTKPNANAAERAFAGTACATHITSTDSGVFGPAGGTLVFGTSRLIIPGGALKDTVTISATSLGGETSRVEFQPHGLEFAKSAGLLLDTSGCAIDEQNAPNVVYLSESGEILEFIRAVFDPHWHTFAAPIDHFSGYAIAF